MPDIDPRFRKNYFEDVDGNDKRLAALYPRLCQQQPDNSKPPATNNESHQQEAPLDQSEIHQTWHMTQYETDSASGDASCWGWSGHMLSHDSWTIQGYDRRSEQWSKFCTFSMEISKH